MCERKNRTILNMVCSILKRSGLPKEFWAEAVLWSTYILNRSPTSSNQYMTPHEAWSGHKPHVNYFCIFKCIAYARVPDAMRKKLDDKGQKSIFLGISDNSKAYCLFNTIILEIQMTERVHLDMCLYWVFGVILWSSKKQPIVTLSTTGQSM